MLETLISSRIRRTLFEYLLTHPTQYFYLRGLAKDLKVSISPLRRELVRLEQAGVLAVVEEANIRFYRVNTESPTYRQLRQAFVTSALPKLSVEPPAHPVATAVIEPGPQPQPAPSPRMTEATRTLVGRGLSPLRSPALIASSTVGIALMLIVASLFYLTMTNDRLVSAVRHALTTQKAEVAVLAPASASGVMRGSRWQLVPGGFGGFSAGANNESY